MRELRDELGDFVVQRRDGIFGYHLACAVDEHAQRISDVVRGADLIGSTFAQLHLMQALSWPPPRYHHVPVMLDTNGLKLSKQNHARPIRSEEHTSELQSLMRNAYAVFCLKKKK